MRTAAAFLFFCLFAAYTLGQNQKRDTEVSPGLYLTSDAMVWAVQSDATTKKLVPIPHHDSDLARHLGANYARSMVFAKQKMTFVIAGERSAVRLRAGTPSFYVQFTEAEEKEVARSLPVNRLAYAIIKLESDGNVRVVGKIDINALTAKARVSQPVVQTNSARFQDSRWIEIVPAQPLLPGEYAITQIMPRPDSYNNWLFDFGVD